MFVFDIKRGRTSSMEFQIALNQKYHKIFEMELPRWPMMRDTLSIWKRNDTKRIGNEMIVSIPKNEINDSYHTNFVNNMIKQYNKTKNTNKKKNNGIYSNRTVDSAKQKK